MSHGEESQEDRAAGACGCREAYGAGDERNAFFGEAYRAYAGAAGGDEEGEVGDKGSKVNKVVKVVKDFRVFNVFIKALDLWGGGVYNKKKLPRFRGSFFLLL